MTDVAIMLVFEVSNKTVAVLAIELMETTDECKA